MQQKQQNNGAEVRGWRAINDLIGSVDGPEIFADHRVEEVQYEAVQQFLETGKTKRTVKTHTWIERVRDGGIIGAIMGGVMGSASGAITGSIVGAITAYFHSEDV